MEQLIAEKIATYKRHVTLKLGDGCDRSYIPGEWLGRPPFNVELRTLHVDRNQLNQRLRTIVVNQGVTFLQDKVVAVETDGRRVAGGKHTTRQQNFFALVSRRFGGCGELVCAGVPSAGV